MSPMSDTPIHTHTPDHGPEVEWVGTVLYTTFRANFRAPDNWLIARQAFMALVAAADVPGPPGPDLVKVFRNNFLDTPTPRSKPSP